MNPRTGLFEPRAAPGERGDSAAELARALARAIEAGGIDAAPEALVQWRCADMLEGCVALAAPLGLAASRRPCTYSHPQALQAAAVTAGRPAVFLSVPGGMALDAGAHVGALRSGAPTVCTLVVQADLDASRYTYRLVVLPARKSKAAAATAAEVEELVPPAAPAARPAGGGGKRARLADGSWAGEQPGGGAQAAREMTWVAQELPPPPRPPPY